MPTSTEPDTGAIHRVLLDSGADPKLIHPAIEEIRHLSGQNVIAAIGAQITELRSETQAQFTELRAEMNTLNTETQAQFTELRAEMNTLNTETQAQFTGLRAEMNTLNTETQAQFTGLRAEMNTLNKVIWPLISLLAIPMFALLYKILTQ